MELIVIYAICSSILAIVVWTAILITMRQDWREHRQKKVRALQAWKHLIEAQELTRMMLRGSVKEDIYG